MSVSAVVLTAFATVLVNSFVQYIAVLIIMYNVEKKLNAMNKEGRPKGGTLYFGLGFCEVMENYKPTDKQ